VYNSAGFLSQLSIGPCVEIYLAISFAIWHAGCFTRLLLSRLEDIPSHDKGVFLMLVLTRKAKQQIQIGPNITITILQIKGQAVRVGVEAPRAVCVLRTELAARPAADSHDPTVMAALKKVERESEISSANTHEDTGGRAKVSANGSLRCRAPRVDGAPVNSPSYQSTGPASFMRPRRRRAAIR
jgi:carbon storage regulator CsrA